MTKIGGELRNQENVMLDTRHLTAEQFTQIDDAVKAAGYGARVLWWP